MKISSVFVKILFAFIFLFLTESAFAEGNGGGGGGIPPTTEQLQEQMKALQRRNEELENEVKKSKKKKLKAVDDEDDSDGDDEDDSDDDTDDDEDDLQKKAKKQNKKLKANESKDKQIESALTFNLTVDKFIEDHKDFLPSEFSEIVKLSHKEKYGSALLKANATRASLIKSFFDVESNLEALTSSQKIKLEDYLKLTLSARQERSGEMYADVFEPALQLIMKIKAAEELGRARNGFAKDSKSDSDYTNRMINQARKTHLGEKGAS